MSHPPENPEFLTTGAAARRLEVSESTIRKYDRDGVLPAIRASSGTRLFRGEDVDRLAEQGLVSAVGRDLR